MKRTTSILFAALLAAAIATVAGASTPGGSPFFGTGYSGGPGSVPVSALAMPSRWLDRSRLNVSSEFTFGSSSGFGSGGLQVTRLSYQFAAPLRMRVSVGNAFGGGVRDDGKFFLEGLDVNYQPFRSMTLNVQYRNLRSPLQMPYGYGYGLYGDPWYSDRSRLIAP